jgi:alpha-beta hydrolase superfamily lysophospholipase
MKEVKMKHTEINWKSSDGLNIYAHGWTPDSGSPNAVVCLVHGLGEHTLRYEHVAEAFTREKLILFGADLRGHGNSEGKRGHFPSIEAVLRDIDQLLKEARNRFPELPLILYGHSLGGILVLHYGLKYKPGIKGIISTSPGLHNALEKQKVLIALTRILGSLMPRMSLPSGLDATAISQDPEVVQLYKNDPLVHSRITFGFGRSMLDVGRWTLEHAGEMSVPVLLLHGKADTIAYASGSIEFAGAVPSKSKLAIWDNGYHELHNEPFRAEVLKTMTDWIKQQI